MELIKEKVTVGEIVFADRFEAECGTSVIVPDVKPDIARVASTGAEVYVSEKIVTDGSVTLKGRVDFTALYVPETGGADVRAIRASAELSHTSSDGKISGGDRVRIRARVTGADAHVINSRKIGFKATCEIDCEVVSGLELELSTEPSEQMEISVAELELNTLSGMCDEEFVICDSFEIPSGKPSVEEVLKLDFEMCDIETKAMTEKLVVRGTVRAHMLYDGGGIEYAEAELPFTEVFDIPGMYEEDECELNLRICDVSAEPEADNDGDLRIISFRMRICAEASAERRESFTVLEDCFMPGFKTRLAFSENEIMTEAAAAREANTVRESFPPPKNAPGIKTVCFARSTAVVTKTEIMTGKAALAGYVKCFVQYIAEDENVPAADFTAKIPFEYLIDLPGAKGGERAETAADVTNTSYRLNAAGEAEVRCALSLCVKLFEPKKIRLITDVKIEEIPKEERKGIVIYFVQPGDTLRSIAKEYCVSPEDIAEFNQSADGDKLCEGQSLIIPTGVR